MNNMHEFFLTDDTDQSFKKEPGKTDKVYGRGKLIAVYTPFKECRGVTSTAAACACLLATKDTHVALSEMPGHEEGISVLFDNHITKSMRHTDGYVNGLTALFLTFIGNRLDYRKVRDCAEKTINDRLDLFPVGARFGRFANPSDITAAKALICNTLLYAYDYVVLDAGHDLSLLREADSAVCVLPQNIRAIKRYMEECKEQQNEIPVISSYVKKSVNNIKTIAFLYGKKPYLMPFCAGFMDALADGAVCEFFDNEFAAFTEREFFKNVYRLGEAVKGGTI